MKKQSIITHKGYDKLKEVEEKLTNRLNNGDNLSSVRVFEVVKRYELKVKLKKIK